jgi:hypothetical protein
VNFTRTGNHYMEWRQSLENNEKSIDNFTEPEYALNHEKLLSTDWNSIQRLKMMQAIELATGDDFLANYNVSIDTSDVIEYMRKATRIWTSKLGESDEILGQYHHWADFILQFKLIMAEVITQRGFCYSFNIAEPSQLFRLEKYAALLTLHSHRNVFHLQSC